VLFIPAIAGLTLRQSLARRRWILVAALACVPILMAVLMHAYTPEDQDAIASLVQIVTSVTVTVVVPIVALVLASSGFGAEIEDGTVVYLLTKPVARTDIVITKLLMTSCVAAACCAASTIVTGMIALGGPPTRLVLAFTVAAALGSVLYTAIFLALGLITRRGMLVGLVYLVVWEGALSILFAGTRTLSVRQYMLSVADAMAKVDPNVFAGSLPHARAYIMSAVVAILALGLSIYRLRRYEVNQA
jgi:ABC-2 type transport system permease protein